MTRLGVVGRPEGATVAPTGEVHLDGGATLAWAVGTLERWVDPALEPTRRQHRLDDMPVVETTVRVPGGDLRVRAYAVADAGGLLVLEADNDSAAPLALAVGASPGLEVAGPRPGDAPPDGAPLGARARVWPLAHRSVLRLVVPLGGAGRAAWPGPSGPASAARVARGWLVQSTPLVRLESGDPAVTAELRAARADVLLEGGPAARLVVAAAGIGFPPGPQEVAAAVGALLGTGWRRRRVPATPGRVWALVAATALLERAGEGRAALDVGRALDRLGPPGLVAVADAGAGALERLAARRAGVVDDRPDAVVLFGAGVIAGVAVEAHDVATRHGRVSVALRWHGDRPALLWDCEPAVALRAPVLDPSWGTTEARGEALLGAVAVPPGR